MSKAKTPRATTPKTAHVPNPTPELGIKTPEPVNHGAVSLAVAVMHKAAQSEAKAIDALDRAKGGTWAAVQEAALCFDAPMSDKDKTALSGELAREYKTRYSSEGSAKAAASQHAKAIHALTHGLGKPEAAKGVLEYLRDASPRTQANAGHAPKNKPETETGAKQITMNGLPVEVGSALIRLIEAARKNPEVGDALVVLANHQTRIVEACEHILTSKPEATKVVKTAPMDTAMALAMNTARKAA